MQDKPIISTTESTARVGTKAPWASGSSMEDADRAVLRGLLEGESEPMVVLALNGNLVGWNRAMEVLLGRVPVAEGGTIFDLVTPASHASWHGWLLRLVNGENVPAVRTCIPEANGQEVWVDASLFAVSLGEDRVLARVRFRDRTRETRAEAAQRASEERFRMLCAMAPVGVFQTDPEGRLTYTNQRWRQLAGLYSAAEPRGLWWQAVHPEDRARVVDLWQSSLRHGNEFFAEFRFLVERGQARWGRTRIAQQAGSDGRVAYCIGTSEDVTDLKRVQSDLAAARDAAMESARLKTQFLSNISHEIRTPMNGVLGMLELLMGTELTESQQRYAGIARESADILLGVMEDILDFSRLEAGRLKLSPQPFSPAEVLSEVIRHASLLADARGISMRLELDPRVPAQVIGDGNRLQQVLAKLVGNAVKFTPEGSVLVRCHQLSVDGQRCLLRFEVVDTGIGIPPGAVERIFHPFVQVDGEPTRRHGGTGLGLALVKQLVELMGGEVKVESVLGSGSTFWFHLTFPLADRQFTREGPGFRRSE
jgi:PAS domain S-box-containing protein